MKYLRWFLQNFEEVASSLLILIMSTFAFINVISRYVIDLSLNFTEELNVYFFVWFAFLGSAWAARKGGHMAVEMFYNLFPKGFRKILYLLIQATIVVFFIAMGYCGYIEICDEIALNTVTETMEVPVWWFTSSIPLGSALIIFRTLQKSAEDLRNGTY